MGRWTVSMPSIIREDPQFTVQYLLYCIALYCVVYSVVFGVLYCFVLSGVH